MVRYMLYIWYYQCTHTTCLSLDSWIVNTVRKQETYPVMPTVFDNLDYQIMGAEMVCEFVLLKVLGNLRQELRPRLALNLARRRLSIYLLLRMLSQ